MAFINIKPGVDVYLTRDSYDVGVRIFPADVGIRKFHGCIEWGAAWSEKSRNLYLSARSNKMGPRYRREVCRELYGIYPRPGTAWFITYTPAGRMRKPKKVDIDFSNKEHVL